MALLEVSQLSFNYGAHRALDGVSLSVDEGECFGLLGPNGAGKSTLLSIISCLREASIGSVMLQGQRLSRSNVAVRALIGIAPQEIAVYPALSARENLLFFGRLYQHSEQQLQARVQSLLESVGLANKADARVETFSGGMQRRINLATALIHQPKLLLLDEPTAGVDPQSRALLFEEIKRCSQNGMTIIYTTHYMEEVEALCSRAAIIDHGKVVANDTLQQLLKLAAVTVEITIDREEPQLLEMLNQLSDVQVETQGDGKEMQVHSRGNADVLTAVVGILAKSGVKPVSIAATTPSLERVFLRLTGRALRD